MASGFNTEIASDGTLFHVQTEERKEAGIETSVYVKGAVVYSVKTLHPNLIHETSAIEQEFARLLEDQHWQVIAQIRAGKIRAPLTPESSAGLLGK